jgi:hypothetical protein
LRRRGITAAQPVAAEAAMERCRVTIWLERIDVPPVTV